MTDTHPLINQEPTVNSADLAKVVTDGLTLRALMGALQQGEKGQHRSIGAGIHPGSALEKSGSLGLGGGNDGIDIRRSVVQEWLNKGQLTLRDEPTTPALQRLYGSPAEFLSNNELTAPPPKSPPTL